MLLLCFDWLAVGLCRDRISVPSPLIFVQFHDSSPPVPQEFNTWDRAQATAEGSYIQTHAEISNSLSKNHMVHIFQTYLGDCWSNKFHPCSISATTVPTPADFVGFPPFSYPRRSQALLTNGVIRYWSTTVIQEVRSLTQLDTTDLHHILSLFNMVSCNWYVPVRAFLQVEDSVVEKLLYLVFQPSIFCACNIDVNVCRR